MIWRVIKLLLLGGVTLLILFWLWTGGFSRVANFVKTIPNPTALLWGGESGQYEIRFPWQISTPQGPDISGLVGTGGSTGASNGVSTADAQAQLDQAQAQYADIQKQLEDAKAYGNPSPYSGRASLSRGSATESDARQEYLEISARGNTEVSLAGWSLQSVLSGTRVPLPPAVPVFVAGVVNTPISVVLSPGETALVSSGPSPIGVSFQETRCTGFLEQTQQFTPSLSNSCPASSDLAPLTVDNLQHYGSDCMDYARSLPSCSFPSSLPSWMPPGCRAYILNTFSYNGCLNASRYDTSFALPTWRLYINSSRELWSNTHDVIRLLDGQGLTVDALSY